jgi:NhaA family Na+:H+ antiporter
MTETATPGRLAPPFDAARDHALGPSDAPLTLVEYGSYACPRCRTANEEITKLRDRFGSRLRYVFRHRPLEGNALARPAADLAERAPDAESFWHAHEELMSRSATLTEDDLRAVAASLDNADIPPLPAEVAAQRVAEDMASAKHSNVITVPTFYINGVRYDGAWDAYSLSEAMLGSLGHRVHSAAVSFASWAPAAALMLGVVTLLALILSNTPAGPIIEQFWTAPLGLSFGDTGFSLSLRQWINDGLLTIFFLVVGLEVKREFTVGRLTSMRLASLPIAAALGGLLVPALLYLAIVPAGPWQPGAGVPMPTDTAFAVALIVMLGSRVPIELRVFLTAASIIDDIGTIIVVAVFYSHGIHWDALLISAALIGLLWLLNRSSVYRIWPYAVIGTLLWFFLHEGGVHATLAGVLLALMIRTRPPPNLTALLAQAEAVIVTEVERGGTSLRHGPSAPAMEALDSIHDRIESPADRLLRNVEPWSSYLVLPLFALANAGLVIASDLFSGREVLATAIAVGLVIGKPLGFLLAATLVIRTGIAEKPSGFTMTQVLGAGALAGIGFTMSLFIAGEAFPDSGDFAAAKTAIFGASLLSALVGCVILTRAKSPVRAGSTDDGCVVAEKA